MTIQTADEVFSAAADDLFSEFSQSATYTTPAGSRYAWSIILDKSVDPRPADFDNYTSERQTLLSVLLSDIPHDTARECIGGSVRLSDGCQYEIDDLETDDGIEAVFRVILL